MDSFPSQPPESSHIVANCDSRTRFYNKVTVVLKSVLSYHVDYVHWDLRSWFSVESKKHRETKNGGFGSSYLHHLYLSHLKITLKLFPQINENAKDIWVSINWL